MYTIKNRILTLKFTDMRIQIQEKIKDLKGGECLLYNETENKIVKFRDIFTAVKNAVNNYRSNRNGWKLRDNIREYPDEEWADLNFEL